MKLKTILELPLVLCDNVPHRIYWHSALVPEKERTDQHYRVYQWPVPALASLIRKLIKPRDPRIDYQLDAVQVALSRLAQAMELFRADRSQEGYEKFRELQAEALVYLMGSTDDGIIEILEWLERYDYLHEYSANATSSNPDSGDCGTTITPTVS